MGIDSALPIAFLLGFLAYIVWSTYRYFKEKNNNK